MPGNHQNSRRGGLLNDPGNHDRNRGSHDDLNGNRNRHFMEQNRDSLQRPTARKTKNSLVRNGDLPGRVGQRLGFVNASRGGHQRQSFVRNAKRERDVFEQEHEQMEENNFEEPNYEAFPFWLPNEGNSEETDASLRSGVLVVDESLNNGPLGGFAGTSGRSISFPGQSARSKDLRSEINNKRRHRNDPGDLRSFLAKKRPVESTLPVELSTRHLDLRDTIGLTTSFPDGADSFLQITTTAEPLYDGRFDSALDEKTMLAPRANIHTRLNDKRQMNSHIGHTTLTVPASPPKMRKAIQSRLGDIGDLRHNPVPKVFPSVVSIARPIDKPKMVNRKPSSRANERRPERISPGRSRDRMESRAVVRLRQPSPPSSDYRPAKKPRPGDVRGERQPHRTVSPVLERRRSRAEPRSIREEPRHTREDTRRDISPALHRHRNLEEARTVRYRGDREPDGFSRSERKVRGRHPSASNRKPVALKEPERGDRKRSPGIRISGSTRDRPVISSSRHRYDESSKMRSPSRPTYRRPALRRSPSPFLEQSPQKTDLFVEYDDIESGSERSYKLSQEGEKSFDDISREDSLRSVSISGDEKEEEEPMTEYSMERRSFPPDSDREREEFHRQERRRPVTPDNESDKEIDHYEMDSGEKRRQERDQQLERRPKSRENPKISPREPYIDRHNPANDERLSSVQQQQHSMAIHHINMSTYSGPGLQMMMLPPQNTLPFLGNSHMNMLNALPHIPVNITALDIHQQQAFLNQKNQRAREMFQQEMQNLPYGQHNQGDSGILGSTLPTFNTGKTASSRMNVKSPTNSQTLTANNHSQQISPPVKRLNQSSSCEPEKFSQIRLKPPQSNLTRISLKPASPPQEIKAASPNTDIADLIQHPVVMESKKKPEKAVSVVVSTPSSIEQQNVSPAKSVPSNIPEGASRFSFKKHDRRGVLNRNKPADTTIDASLATNPSAAPDWILKPAVWNVSANKYADNLPICLSSLPKPVLQQDPRLTGYLALHPLIEKLNEENVEKSRLDFSSISGDQTAVENGLNEKSDDSMKTIVKYGEPVEKPGNLYVPDVGTFDVYRGDSCLENVKKAAELIVPEKNEDRKNMMENSERLTVKKSEVNEKL